MFLVLFQPGNALDTASLLREALGSLGPLVQVYTRHVLFPGSDSGFAGNGSQMNIGSRETGHVSELGGPGLVIVLIPVGLHPLDIVKP